jgi:hypothetical protein
VLAPPRKLEAPMICRWRSPSARYCSCEVLESTPCFQSILFDLRHSQAQCQLLTSPVVRHIYQRSSVP